MSGDERSPERQRSVEALVAEFEAQASRVGVDLREGMSQLNERFASIRSDITVDDEGSESYTESFTIDVSGIVDTLRRLPDGAGTSAFVAAYNREHPDWRGTPRRG